MYRKQNNKDNKDSDMLFIADTKWKIISEFNSISEADLYQMFAYLANYECENGILIYHKINVNEITNKKFKYNAESNLTNKKSHKLKISFLMQETNRV